MSKKSWNDFLEPMNHEINNCSITLEVKACRVDNGCIKDYCQINNPESNNQVKSCDYFYIPDGRNLFLCIEFSDLLSQKYNIDKNVDEIKTSKIKRKKANHIIAIYNSSSVISNEIENKITGTDFILKKLYSGECDQYIDDIPRNNFNKYHFLVVYYLPSSDEIDRARMSDFQGDEFKKEKDKLKSKLAILSLNHIDIKEVHWLEIRTFKEIYCN